jgi:hypothetical protein
MAKAAKNDAPAHVPHDPLAGLDDTTGVAGTTMTEKDAAELVNAGNPDVEAEHAEPAPPPEIPPELPPDPEEDDDEDDGEKEDPDGDEDREAAHHGRARTTTVRTTAVRGKPKRK